jgi:integrase
VNNHTGTPATSGDPSGRSSPSAARGRRACRASGDSVAKLEMIKVVLSSALSCAMREELVTRNVAQLVTLPSEPRARRIAWTAAQARVFLRAAADDPAYPVFVLALVYGLGRGEIAALRWEDVDFVGGRIFVRASLVRVDGRLVRGPVKSAAGVQALPLVALSRAALIAARDRQTEQRTAAGMPEHVTDWAETGYVFTTRSGRPVEPRNLSRSFDRIVTAAGLPSIVFHDLRRTAATMLEPRRSRPRRPDHPRSRQHCRDAGRLQRGVRHRDRHRARPDQRRPRREDRPQVDRGGC